MIVQYATLSIMMLFIIAPVNVLWLHFMFSLQKLLWNVLTGRSLSCCRGKRKFGTSENQYFSWSIHRKQKSGEKSSVIETVVPMIVTESPPCEYSRSSYLSISFYLSTYLSLLLILSRNYPLSVAPLNHLPLTLRFAVWLLPHPCYHSFSLSLSISLSFSLFLCGLLVPSAFNPNNSLSIPSSSLNLGTIPLSLLISLSKILCMDHFIS